MSGFEKTHSYFLLSNETHEVGEKQTHYIEWDSKVISLSFIMSGLTLDDCFNDIQSILLRFTLYTIDNIKAVWNTLLYSMK